MTEIDCNSSVWPSGVSCTKRLFLSGNVSLLGKKAISIVGTRNPSEEAKKLTRSVVDAVGQDYVILSGLALGVDGCAHIEALARGFDTVAVIGTPLERCYPPEHKRLMQSIEQKGLVVSQFAPGTAVERYFFMQRNLLMSQLCVATVVVEDSPSGGGVKEAIYCEKAGKPVFVFKPLAGKTNLKSPYIIDKADEIIGLLKTADRQPELF